MALMPMQYMVHRRRPIFVRMSLMCPLLFHSNSVVFVVECTGNGKNICVDQRKWRDGGRGWGRHRRYAGRVEMGGVGWMVLGIDSLMKLLFCFTSCTETINK